MDDNKMINIETFNFEIKPYQWYQWMVKRRRVYITTLGVYLQETYKHNMGKFGNMTTSVN